MNNIFTERCRQSTLRRFEKLSSASQRRWGSMTIEEMLWHLRSQLELALGIREQTTHVQTYLSKPFFRWLALYIMPWPKSARTAKEMNVKRLNPEIKDFSTEKNLLMQRLQQMDSTGDFHPHPLFGKMSKELWGRLVWKHFNHHLNQFGV